MRKPRFHVVGVMAEGVTSVDEIGVRPEVARVVVPARGHHREHGPRVARDPAEPREAGSGRGQHEPPDPVRRLVGQLLGDRPAQ